MLGKKKMFVLGGANIYAQTQNLWNKLYLTKIDTVIENGTAFFPEIDFSKWDLVNEEKHMADDKNPFNYTFCTYHKKNFNS